MKGNKRKKIGARRQRGCRRLETVFKAKRR